MKDFKSIEYLKTGNPRQKQAYLTLKKYGVIEKLHQFQPVLAGTIPIEIDLPDSDLDIVCFCKNLEEFSNKVVELYGTEPSFKIYSREINGIISTIATFLTPEFTIELFGQNLPISQQSAYKHLITESKILDEKGEDFRNEVKMLKAQGYKTEPAFAKLLNLKGDPYQELLSFQLSVNPESKNN